MWRRTILATAIVGAGLASTTGAAFAGNADEGDNSGDHGHSHGHDHWGHGDHHNNGNDNGCTNKVEAHNGSPEHPGLVDASDVQTITPVNICGNHIGLGILDDLPQI